jgi:hypothetical protein
VGLVDSGHGGGGGARNIAEHLFTAKKEREIFICLGVLNYLYNMDYMRNNCLKYEIRGFAYRARIRKLLRIPGIDSARLCNLAGRYDK